MLYMLLMLIHTTACVCDKLARLTTSDTAQATSRT